MNDDLFSSGPAGRAHVARRESSDFGNKPFLTFGILSNALVTLANDGFMPVAARRQLAGPARSLWVQRASGQRLLFLADISATIL